MEYKLNISFVDLILKTEDRHFVCLYTYCMFPTSNSPSLADQTQLFLYLVAR